MAEAHAEQQGTFRPDLLSGQTAIITGGGSGLGFGIAQALSRHGANVVLAARKLERLEAAAEQIRAAGGQALAVQCDIRDAEQVERMVQRTEDAFGRIHMLVNNAGAAFFSKAEDLSPNGWRSVIDIDINGTFLCSQAVARRMIRDGGGSIVCITTTSPWNGNPYRSNGGAGKAAIASMVKSLAVEWGQYGIRINEVGPGSIPTAAMAAMGEAAEDAAAHIPLRRVGTPADVADATLFLMSDAASFLTGNRLVVDGGASFGSRHSQ
jgi:NAD(P)-dependent dehydrogenase (short-subunit alcohol dehydrogenase family)